MADDVRATYIQTMFHTIYMLLWTEYIQKRIPSICWTYELELNDIFESCTRMRECALISQKWDVEKSFVIRKYKKVKVVIHNFQFDWKMLNITARCLLLRFKKRGSSKQGWANDDTQHHFISLFDWIHFDNDAYEK